MISGMEGIHYLKFHPPNKRSNKFGKRAVRRLQTRIYFRKKSRDQVDEIIDQIRGNL